METGVAYGVTSAYMLQALEDNAFGRLVSIDLPPLSRKARQWVGTLVPDHLRHRWNLHIGSAQKLLPKLLRQEGKLDMFVHDSLHTYAHMQWEFATIWKALQPGGVLIADDISGNRAFEECLKQGVDNWTAIRQEEKNSLCGILRMPKAASTTA
jgi:predicted O-methyltransferase YrrM